MNKKLFQEYLILVPRQEDRSRVKEHLRYWPYVKAFSGQSVISVRVFIGLINEKERPHYVKRSRELISLCLRQYRAMITPVRKGFANCPFKYMPDLYLRPNELLKDFRSFIDELDRPAKTNYSTLNFKTSTK